MWRKPNNLLENAPGLPPLELTIERIGSAGDGVASASDGSKLHVARTLPGEVVLAQPSAPGRDGGRATLSRIVAPSPDRVAPPCRHFDELCGGCALQHWADAAYAGYKRDLIAAALTRAGFHEPAVAPLQRSPPHSRRRMDFAILRREGGIFFGLHQANSTAIIDLQMCEILHPTLFALVAPLRSTLAGLAAIRRSGSLLANLADNGPDLLLRTDGPLAPTDRTKLAAFAAAHAIPRISWARGTGATEPAAAATLPFVTFGGQRIEAPPGAFLQATAQGEAAIVQAVLAGLPDRLTGRARAIELYAGIGTLSFPLAARLRVQAYEGDEAAAASLRRAQAGTRVQAIHRDLTRQPLSAKELGGAAAIVLDPPYQGATMQMAPIAASAVPRIIYVSCNPVALARDTALLAQSGYCLLAATPIDQFLWSPQVECVAVFHKS